MSGEWIKMRVGLTTHPRVLTLAETLMADPAYEQWACFSCSIPGVAFGDEDRQVQEREYYAALRVTRYVTVAALLRVWGYVNEHADGELVRGLRLRDIDEIAQVPNFGAAMELAGWAKHVEKSGVLFPNFGEHNAISKERSSAAERQKRYRERQKKASDVTSDAVTVDVTRDVTSRPREEKRREEKKERPRACGTRLPADWALPDDWKLEAEKIAKDEGFSINAVREGLKFRDFWIAKAGKDGSKSDWRATWRGWVRRAGEFAPKANVADAPVIPAKEWK